MFAISAHADNWYAVGSVGQSQFHDSKSSADSDLVSLGATGLSSKLTKKDDGYKLQLGYRFTPNIALEGGQVDLGMEKYKASYIGGEATLEGKAKGLNLALLGIYPINDQFALFGKLGVIDAKVNVKSTQTGFADSRVSSTDMKANFGLGASYNFASKDWNNFGVRAEWERFNKLGDTAKTGETNVDLLSVGLVINF
jgi:OOP family OmpA-OmpF porin